MAFTESRLRRGSLILGGTGGSGGTTFSCQPSAVTIAPERTAASGEDDLELLCGDIATSGAGSSLTATLNITALQDFTNAAGLTAYSWSHDGEEVEFQWNPGEVAGNLWTGKVKITALNVGGEVGARLTNDAEWAITLLRTPTAWGGTYVIGAAPATP